MQFSIPLSYNPIDIESLSGVLANYQNLHHNKMVEDFERGISELTGSYAVALSSGTAAVHLALKILGVGNNDTVLAPTFTYIATVNPALYLGARLMLIDASPDTWNMQVDLLEKAIHALENQSIKPKALIVVHTYGMPSDMAGIMQIAEKHNIPIVEDAAESLGSTWHGKLAGTFGKIGIFSFNDNKTVTTFGGGVLLTKDSSIAKRARFLASQARESLPYYQHPESGFNYRMGPLNAAYGLSQLPKLYENVKKRQTNFHRYQTAFANLPVKFQMERPEMASNRWFSTVLFDNQHVRLEVTKALSANNIETRPLWKPMHLQPVFSGMQTCLTGVSENLFERGLCLPSGNNLNPGDQAKIVDIIRQVTTASSARI